MWKIFESVFEGEYIGALRLIDGDGKTIILGLRAFGNEIEISTNHTLAEWDVKKVKNNDKSIVPTADHFRKFITYIFEHKLSDGNYGTKWVVHEAHRFRKFQKSDLRIHRLTNGEIIRDMYWIDLMSEGRFNLIIRGKDECSESEIQDKYELCEVRHLKYFIKLIFECSKIEGR